MKAPKYFVPLGILAFATAAHAADVSTISGSVAFASFDHWSDDSCVHTQGELVVVQARHGGELDDGVYVTGSQEDVCAGTGRGFADYDQADFSVNGFTSAHVDGTFVVSAYAGADANVDVDLTWTGSGAIQKGKYRYEDENGISFTYTKLRAATVAGTFTLDGVEMPITDAFIGAQASGTIQR